jgi:hypothetical protein
MSDVDEAICKHLGGVDRKLFVEGWFGIALACGKDWDWLRECCKDYPTDLAVIDYLEANYTVTAWARR